MAFLQEIVYPKHQQGTVIAGNSLGGFAALYSSAESKSKQEDLVKGCILINAAGRFRPTGPVPAEKSNPEWIQSISASIQRFVIGLSFIYTKQPARIAQVLRQVDFNFILTVNLALRLLPYMPLNTLTLCTYDTSILF